MKFGDGNDNLFYLHSQITCLNSCTFFNCSYQWTHNVIISYIIYNISYSFLYVPFSDKNKQVRILPKSYFQMQGIDNCLNTAQKQSLPLLITKTTITTIIILSKMVSITDSTNHHNFDNILRKRPLNLT